MRKTALKKKYPGRNKFIKQMRKTDNLHEFVGRSGEKQYLNVRKHVFYRKPYKRWEHQMEMLRLMKDAQERAKKRDQVDKET